MKEKSTEKAREKVSKQAEKPVKAKKAKVEKPEVERNQRRVKNGVIIGTKMAKTVIVRVERKYRHPMYQKVVTSSKKYYAHDEKADTLKEGDKVTIVECRPISKLKRWRVVREG